jgi:glutathione-dependent peroxiredoxin
MKNENDKWVVLGTEGCPFCKKATDLITATGHFYTYFDIDDHQAIKAFCNASGFKTVPQVFLNGYLIGGFTEVEEYLRQEMLDKAQMDLFDRIDPLGR